MHTHKFNSQKSKEAIQSMAFGAAKPVAPYIARQVEHERRLGDPSSVRESRYPLPAFLEQRHRPVD